MQMPFIIFGSLEGCWEEGCHALHSSCHGCFDAAQEPNPPPLRSPFPPPHKGAHPALRISSSFSTSPFQRKYSRLRWFGGPAIEMRFCFTCPNDWNWCNICNQCQQRHVHLICPAPVPGFVMKNIRVPHSSCAVDAQLVGISKNQVGSWSTQPWVSDASARFNPHRLKMAQDLNNSVTGLSARSDPPCHRAQRVGCRWHSQCSHWGCPEPEEDVHLQFPHGFYIYINIYIYIR